MQNTENDEISLKYESIENGKVVVRFAIHTEYLEIEPTIKEVLEMFFGADFLGCRTETTDTKTTFVIETAKENLFKYFDQFQDILKPVGDNGIMNYAYSNKN